MEGRENMGKKKDSNQEKIKVTKNVKYKNRKGNVISSEIEVQQVYRKRRSTLTKSDKR